MEGTIKNGQFRDIGNIMHTNQRTKTKTETNTGQKKIVFSIHWHLWDRYVPLAIAMGIFMPGKCNFFL